VIKQTTERGKKRWAERDIKGFKKKACDVCGIEYTPTSSFQKYCDICGKTVKKEQVKKVMARSKSKRRQLGYSFLNEPFENSTGHHINKEQVVFIPVELHKSISHNVWTGKNMNLINEMAYKYIDLIL
jgi:methionyl-tRNA synthetase